MDPVEVQLYLGKTFSGQNDTYLIQTLIGRGGFAGVFQAQAQGSGEEVAIKVLAFNGRPPNAASEFAEEIQLLGLLASCSNVVTLLDTGSYSTQLTAPGGLVFPVDVPFMVLDRAEIGLDALLADRHQISWIDRLCLYRDLVKGVHQMHLRKFVHRDVKAANALVYQGKPQGRLTDLGRSKDTRQPPRYPPRAYLVGMGDRRFAPPELLWGLGETSAESHCRTDLYLLGSLFYEFATATGITAVALTNPFTWVTRAAGLPTQQAREKDYQAHLSYLRNQFQSAYLIFENELPRGVAKEATTLLRQLTDPDPARREPTRLPKGLPSRWDLQWLLYRVRVFVKRLERDEAEAKRRAKARSSRKRKVSQTP